MGVVVPRLAGRWDHCFRLSHTEFDLRTDCRWKPSIRHTSPRVLRICDDILDFGRTWVECIHFQRDFVTLSLATVVGWQCGL